jgi:Protein of unknown function (DUF3723)
LERARIDTGFTTAEEGIPVQQRCGIPFQKAQDSDSKSLHFQNMTPSPNQPDVGVTSLFVRTCFFIAFFGEIPTGLLVPPGRPTYNAQPDVGSSAVTDPSDRSLVPHQPSQVDYDVVLYTPNAQSNVGSSAVTDPPDRSLIPYQPSQANYDIIMQDNITQDNVPRDRFLPAESRKRRRSQGPEIIIEDQNSRILERYVITDDTACNQGSVKEITQKLAEGRWLLIGNHVVSPEDAIDCAIRSVPPARITVVEPGALNRILEVRGYNPETIRETQASQVMVVSTPEQEDDGIT